MNSWQTFGSLLRYLTNKLRNKREVSFYPTPLISQHTNFKNLMQNHPKITVIIPTRDKSELLRSCIDSVLSTTDGLDLEVVVVNNGSSEAATEALFTELRTQGIKIIDFPGKFNFSAICNFGVRQSEGDLVCFLNNDTVAASSNWLARMAEHAIEPEVGLVGAVLQFEDTTIQHMGVALGYNGVAGHPFQHQSLEKTIPTYCYEVDAVTFACAVIARDKFIKIGELDVSFPVGFNDVDFSIRTRSMGFKNAICREAVLTHLESQTRPRTSSTEGLFQGLRDVVRIIIKHPGRLTDRFFLS
jgi:GT2 family glycosyltransferase